MRNLAAYEGLTRFLVILSSIVLVGTLGYAYIEGWQLADGFFMTIITLSTVGYGETHELSQAGRWFTMGLIFSCVVAMACFTAMLTSLVVEDSLSGRTLRRRVIRMVSKLKDHVIVCGSDMMAQAIVEQLMRQRRQVVVVDDQPEGIARLKRRYRRLLIIEGNAKDEMRLAEANVLNASSVVAATSSEVDNLLIGIACKAMGCGITIYARANDITIANSMRKAGVDAVVSPSQLCGAHVADLIRDDVKSSTASKESDAEAVSKEEPTTAGVS